MALKTLHRDAQQVARSRFMKEAEAARRVAPFCTAKVLEAGLDGDTPYIVTEYVEGRMLDESIRQGGPLLEDSLIRLAIGVATALSAIHHSGVLHRDLKPGNVLLSGEGQRVTDFGIARAPGMSLTRTGAVTGTFGYMAPEVLSGSRAAQAADVFAWGALIIFAASGVEPFRGANIGEVAHRTAFVEPDLSLLPPRVRPLVAAAVAKDPQLRPSSLELLTGLVGDMPGSADPRRTSSCSIPWKSRWASRRAADRAASARAAAARRSERSAPSPAARMSGARTVPATAVAGGGQMPSTAAAGPSAGRLVPSWAARATRQAHRPAFRGRNPVARSTAGTVSMQRCPIMTNGRHILFFHPGLPRRPLRGGSTATPPGGPRR
ncbi:hypothetical protein GCM10010271_29730 [Streptomyces kurssanovii]|nr:hypothetical protein GCM10010271_29730 [Streptomyces kurssanovii]